MVERRQLSKFQISLVVSQGRAKLFMHWAYSLTLHKPLITYKMVQGLPIIYLLAPQYILYTTVYHDNIAAV